MREAHVAVMALVLALGCGGADRPTSEAAAPSGGDDAVELAHYDDVDGTLVPPEKYEEIQLALSRRAPQISRCYSDAIERGSLDRNARGTLLVELVVERDGKPSGVRILPSSTLKSDEVWACCVATIERVQFASLPKPLPFTYSYKLERDY
jgi:hypothetical protein